MIVNKGLQVGRKRVARLMRRAGVHGVSRRKQFRTTVREETARPAPDLVDRQFQAPGPDRLWVADITYVPTWAGFLYLAVVLDAWSRRVIGWAMESHLRTELVLDALDMAVATRRPSSVIHHSDQGCQYTSLEFGRRCREACVRPSMGSVGDAYDNAMCESFFATLECELLDRHRFRTQVEARLAIFDFIEGWYNHGAVIPHSTICRRWFTREPTRPASAQWRQDQRSCRGVLSRYPSQGQCSEEHGGAKAVHPPPNRGNSRNLADLSHQEPTPSASRHLPLRRHLTGAAALPRRVQDGRNRRSGSPGTGDRRPPESVFRIVRNRCSGCSGIRSFRVRASRRVR